MPPLTASTASAPLVSYDPRYHTPAPDTGAVFEAPFVTARTVLDRLPPGAAVDEALVSSKEARDFANMTPFAPTPDAPGRLSPLHIPTQPDMSGPISAPALLPPSRPHYEASGPSVHDSQLPVPSFSSTMGGPVLALVERLEHEFLFDEWVRDAAV